MAYTIPDGTKFATLNLARCAVADDISDPLTLAHDITIHRAPLFELGGDFESDIGTRNAEQFKELEPRVDGVSRIGGADDSRR